MTNPVRYQILYFGNAWFTENRTSSHHVARWLARSHDVHYFECPGLRAPSGSSRDVRKIFRQLYRIFKKPVHCDGVTVRTLLQLPFHRFALVRRLNEMLMRRAVQRVVRRFLGLAGIARQAHKLVHDSACGEPRRPIERIGVSLLLHRRLLGRSWRERRGGSRYG